MKKREEGFILIVSVITLLVMLIFVPALVYITQNESHSSVKQKQSTMAFQAAEAGIDRAIWKLQESDATWNVASTGAVLAGYNFDVVYYSTNTAGEKESEYAVRITTSLTEGYVLVQSIGRDASTNEERAIEAEYTKLGLGMGGGLIVRGSITFKPHLLVDWGPIIDYSGTVTGEPVHYPRIITKGGLTQDSNPNPPNGHDFYQAWPNPATYNYNTYQTNLGNAPTIDLNAFKEIAKNCRVPPIQNTSGGTAISSPTGSGYFTERVKMLTPAGADYRFYCSTCVIYVDAGAPGTESVTFKGTGGQVRLRGLIMTGDLELKLNAGDTVPDFTARIPSTARMEYYKSGTAATFWTANGWTNGGSAVLNPVRVIGYVYVGGDMSTSSAQDPIVYGILDIQRAITINNTQVYFDEFASTSVLTTNQNPVLSYWREVNPGTISGLGVFGP